MSALSNPSSDPSIDVSLDLLGLFVENPRGTKICAAEGERRIAFFKQNPVAAVLGKALKKVGGPAREERKRFKVTSCLHAIQYLTEDICKLSRKNRENRALQARTLAILQKIIEFRLPKKRVSKHMNPKDTGVALLQRLKNNAYIITNFLTLDGLVNPSRKTSGAAARRATEGRGAGAEATSTTEAVPPPLPPRRRIRAVAVRRQSSSGSSAQRSRRSRLNSDTQPELKSSITRRLRDKGGVDDGYVGDSDEMSGLEMARKTRRSPPRRADSPSSDD